MRLHYTPYRASLKANDDAVRILLFFALLQPCDT